MDLPQMPNAVCATMDPDLHFAHANGKSAVKQAKKNCANCAHRAQCLEYSLHWDVFGVWGGLTEPERITYRTAHNLPLPQPLYIGDFVDPDMRALDDWLEP